MIATLKIYSLNFVTSYFSTNKNHILNIIKLKNYQHILIHIKINTNCLPQAELLSLSGAPPASLRTYLQAAARQAPAPAALQLLDLLWKVLEKAGDHLAAAHVLEGLATKPGFVGALFVVDRVSGLCSLPL